MTEGGIEVFEWRGRGNKHLGSGNTFEYSVNVYHLSSLSTTHTKITTHTMSNHVTMSNHDENHV